MRNETINRISVVEYDAIVYVIDNEAAMLDSIEALLSSAGLTVRAFSCAQDFFASQIPDVAACLILEVRLKGRSGFTVREQMMAHRIRMPVIFVTAYGDIAMAVQAMKSGASDFLTKPFREQDMLDAVAKALADDRQRRRAELSFGSLLRCFESMTRREQEVTGFVANGLRNKQIATEMGLSEMTVRLYRGRAMKKMEVGSFAEFVVKANVLRRGLQPPDRPAIEIVMRVNPFSGSS